MCACHKLDFYSLVQRQTERSLLSFQSTPIPHSHHFFAAWLIMKKQKPCLMIGKSFSHSYSSGFDNCDCLNFWWAGFKTIECCSELCLDNGSFWCEVWIVFAILWFPYLKWWIWQISGAGLIQLRIKNLFKVGSRQCFQRKSPLSSRKSFSHFYFTPNYPARPLLTPLNFSLHNLTSTQNLLNV